MSRWVAVVLALAVALGWGVSVLAPAPAEASIQDEIDKIRRRMEKFERDLRNAEQRRRQTQQNINRLQQEERSLVGQVLSLEEQIEAAERRLAVLEEELAEAEERLARAEADLAEAQETLAYRESLLSSRIRTVYERGTVSYLEVLFAATSFQDFLQRFQALRLIVGKDSSLFEAAREYRQVVQGHKDAVDAERARVVALIAEQQADKQRVEVMKANREQDLADVQSNRAELEAALDELDRISEDIEAQLKATQEELNDLYQALGVVPSTFLSMPVDTSGYWRISSRFGPRYHPILNINRAHNGMDFGAHAGTAIKAVWPGVVTYSGLLGGYGNTVMIAHGLDERGRQVVTLYAHASTLRVSTGQQVQAGDVIATVGATGLATGPHLHLEVRLNGTPVNPEPYLPR